MVGHCILLDTGASHASRQHRLLVFSLRPRLLFLSLLFMDLILVYQIFKYWNSSRLGCKSSCHFYLSLSLGFLIHSHNSVTTSMSIPHKATSFCKDLLLQTIDLRSCLGSPLRYCPSFPSLTTEFDTLLPVHVRDLGAIHGASSSSSPLILAL